VSEHLFVYGTLRAGAHAMHDVLADSAELVGGARARGLLFDLGWYPGLVETPEDRWVLGEVWRLRQPDVLQRLDAYEGEEYERCRRAVRLDGGRSIEAWVYVYRGSTRLHRQVEHGDWLAHHERRS
jgi:gamma-glutamylcyclotransferase (GGCT)/AIG2-like uncharacterized protein YtfP